MVDNNLNTAEKFNQLYTDISSSIAAAAEEISTINVDHKDGKEELSSIMERLGIIRARFDDELSLLEKHAEWDKFTIAFFGETNAGKSTILESLRILFNEDSRQQLLQKNARNLDKFEQELNYHVNLVRNGLNTIYAAYANEITAIKTSIAALTSVLKDEAAARNRVLQEESSSRITRKLRLFAIGGFSIGGIVVGGLAMLLGRVI